MRASTQPSFTLIELMAASTVLSLILLLMVGMQDQMSRAWSNANRRSDATREANAACRTIAQDFSCLIYRAPTWDTASANAESVRSKGIPFLYFSNGTMPFAFSVPNSDPSSSYFFAVTAKAPSSTGQDVSILGYYIARASWTNVNGFITTNYNLYRYCESGSAAAANLTAWLNTVNPSPALLFRPTTNDEILARNVCNLRITAFNTLVTTDTTWGNRVTNGLNYRFADGGSAPSTYSGSKLQVEMSVYPDEIAQRLPLDQWTNSNNIQRFARSYELRLDIRRD